MSDLTKKAIKQSFIKLLNEKPLNQITVKDIVDDCGVNRNTFYYHFTDIPSLLEEIIEDEANRIIEEYPTIDSIEQCLEVAISFAMKNKRAVLHIYHSVSRELYEKYLMDVCNHVVNAYINTLLKDQPISPEDREILIRFYKCECFGQIIDWMNDEMREDIRVPFKRLCELRKGMVDEMVRRCLKNSQETK